jgi:glycosyltransferase involved in cell wall biosynthesis
LTTEACDVVHDHTLVGPFLAPDPLPVITTNHLPFDDVEMATVYRRLPPTISLVAISHDQAAAGRRAGITVDHVIHHGVDVDEIPEGDGRGDEHGPYLLCLGRMSPDKGVLVAIAIAEAAGARLLIAAKVNEPEERRYFDTEIAPRCGDRIEFLGEVGGPDKCRLLGGAAALLNPIQWPEPFGLVMIESLAAGTPVIATPWGAAPEIVEHGVNGFLGADTDALVDAVRNIEDIDRHRCRLDVARRFGVDLMVRRHVDAYRRLLERRRVHRRRPTNAE